MIVRKRATFAVILLSGRFLLADASYQESSQITGGAMVQALQSVSFLKSVNNMFAPTTTVTMVHGNRKAVVRKDSTEITDLDQETITRIDNLHKTYTVMTFAQMRQAFANLPKQLEQAQAQTKPAQAEQPRSDIQTSFEVSVKNTGVSREINGLMAQEQLVTMQMHATDPNAPASEAGTSITYVVTTDVWIAPDPPEVKEIQDFDLRMGKQLMASVDLTAFKSQMSQNPAMASLFSGKPGSAEAMAQMQTEMAKLHGTRVMEVTRMGGSSTAAATQNSPQAAPPPAAPATDTTAQTATPAPSAMGMLGSALGGSALGGFHRKKAAAPAPAATPAAATTDGTQDPSAAVLMEMTMQKSNFSQQDVSMSAFLVPPGFKKVEAPGYGK